MTGDVTFDYEWGIEDGDNFKITHIMNPGESDESVTEVYSEDVWDLTVFETFVKYDEAVSFDNFVVKFPLEQSEESLANEPEEDEEPYNPFAFTTDPSTRSAAFTIESVLEGD